MRVTIKRACLTLTVILTGVLYFQEFSLITPRDSKLTVSIVVALECFYGCRGIGQILYMDRRYFCDLQRTFRDLVIQSSVTWGEFGECLPISF